MDIATLGLAVDSRQVVKAKGALDQLTPSAKRAETAHTRLGGATSRVSATMSGATAATHAQTTALRGFTSATTAANTAVGALLTRLAAPLAGGVLALFGGRAFFQNTIAQQNAVTQLEAAIRSTGGAAGFTAAELTGMAGALQRVTTFGDEAIVGSQALLLTFTRIGREVFPQAQEAILNVATAMRTDLQSATVQVGKALNDPIAGLTALTRSGIQFTDAQKDQIEILVESGRVVDAQRMILRELETQFGGSARAARNTLGGAIAGLTNAFGDLFEVSSEGSDNLTGAINRLTDLLSSSSTIAAVQNFGAVLFDAFAGALDQVRTLVAGIDALRRGNFKDAFGALAYPTTREGLLWNKQARLNLGLFDPFADPTLFQPSPTTGATGATGAANSNGGGAAGSALADPMVLSDMATTTERLNSGLQKSVDLFGGFSRSIREGGNAFDYLAGRALSALDSIIDRLLNMAGNNFLNAILGGLFGGFGGAAGGVGIGMNALSTLYAKGAAFQGGNVVPFARGGVVNRPTLFPMANGIGLMGEAGPEAVMPLKRGPNGRLGVEGGGTTYHIAVDARGAAPGVGEEVERAISRAIDRNNRYTVPRMIHERRSQTLLETG